MTGVGPCIGCDGLRAEVSRLRAESEALRRERDVARRRREEAEKARDGYRSSWLDEESLRQSAEARAERAERERDEAKAKLAAELLEHARQDWDYLGSGDCPICNAKDATITVRCDKCSDRGRGAALSSGERPRGGG